MNTEIAAVVAAITSANNEERQAAEKTLKEKRAQDAENLLNQLIGLVAAASQDADDAK